MSQALSQAFAYAMPFVMAAITATLIWRWIRGLVVYFTRREEYGKLIRTRMFHGDGGDGKAVSIPNQLFFSYPLGILIGGFGTYASFFWHH